VRIALPDANYPKVAQRVAFLRRLLQDLNHTAGVEMAGAADQLPLSGENNWGRINVVGRPILDATRAPAVEGRTVSANYFHLLGIPLLRGREFTDDDIAKQRRVAVINQEMANQFWPGGDPVGQRLASAYRPEVTTEIIGVVGNIKDDALDRRSPPEMYTPFSWWNTMNVVVRANGGTLGAALAVRAAVTLLDREVPVYGARPMEELVTHSLARHRFEVLLLGAFAGIALLLASVGIYGLLAFTVHRRTHEIGLRMALGAPPRGVLGLLLSHGMKLVGCGLAIGMAASMALTRVMSGMLYGVEPVDPASLAAVCVVMAASGAFACWVPARRAMAVDPMTALRGE
jgi:putative ABC transport system permease protein